MATSKWTPVGSTGSGAFLKWEQDGQELEGAWQGQSDGRFGPVGTLKLPDGRAVRFPLHAALLDRMRRVKEGAEVLIRYTGKQESKAGRTFKAFEVYVADPDAILHEPEGEVPF